MAKVCCVCEKTLGFFSDKITLKDGYLCHKCLKSGGISSLSIIEGLRTAQVVEVIKTKRELVRNFRATKRFSRLEIDTNSKSFKLDENYYSFDNLLSYAYHEDPDNSRLAVHNGKQGGAAIGGMIGGLGGGLIGGAIGAAVGGKIGSLFSTACNYMYISVTLKDSLESDVRLDFISVKTRVSSNEYSEALKRAKDCLDGLQIIEKYNVSKQQTIADEKKQYSKREVFIHDRHLTASELAEELRIYKNLLYSGDITQEEFDQKKKKLLDML